MGGPVSMPAPVRGPMPYGGTPMPVMPVRNPMQGPVLGSFKRGGKVKKTGLYKLHRGEKVMSLASLRKAK